MHNPHRHISLSLSALFSIINCTACRSNRTVLFCIAFLNMLATINQNNAIFYLKPSKCISHHKQSKAFYLKVSCDYFVLSSKGNFIQLCFYLQVSKDRLSYVLYQNNRTKSDIKHMKIVSCILKPRRTNTYIFNLKIDIALLLQQTFFIDQKASKVAFYIQNTSLGIHYSISFIENEV